MKIVLLNWRSVQPFCHNCEERRPGICTRLLSSSVSVAKMSMFSLENKLSQHSRLFTVTFFVVLLVLSDASFAFATRFQLNQETTQTQNPECNIDCSNMRPRPFCGTDGRTYMSKCEVKKARCLGRNVRKVHSGHCELTKCQGERAQNLFQAGTSTVGVFVPQCNDDGSYAMVQCHKTFGYCWCVTEDGKPVPGSSVREGRPSCDRQPGDNYPVADNVPTFRSAPTTSLASGCVQEKRTTFNKNLKNIFKEEFARLPLMMDISALPISSSQASLEREKQVIEWKFTELDSNGDRNLDDRDLKPLLRLMKKIVKPKVCAKDFVNHCDLDEDGLITDMEWSFCLGVDNKEQPEEPTADSGSQDGRSTSPPLLVTRQVPPGENTEVAVIESCESERQRALDELERLPNSGIFVPQCTPAGDYRAVQCHEQAQYCWCVYVDTGRPIPGTSTRSSTKEDCSPVATSRSPSAPREFVDCPDDKKGRFLIKLVDKLHQQMTAAESPGIETTTQAQVELSSNDREESIIWKFSQLDRNSNNILESKEIDPFRDDVDRVKSSKKCRNNFLDYCDSNQDLRLSLREWLQCFDISPAAPTEEPPRRGRNPFIDRLT